MGNGSLKNLYKYKSKIGKSKVNFVNKVQALRSASRRYYDGIVPAGTVYVDCHNSNVIYLITCNKFFMLVKQC